MEMILVPPTAASKRLHLGNLYNWVLIDVYKKAKKFLGESVLAYETWNCYSQRLENEMKALFPLKNEKELVFQCKEEVTKAIFLGREQMKRYGIILDAPEIRDDSKEYSNFVQEYIDKADKEGRIFNEKIKIPPLEIILQRASKINWTPKAIENKFLGFNNLGDLSEFTLFRKGSYGMILKDGKVCNQRLVQSLLPCFYSSFQKDNLIGIFGNDVLIKWIYFMIANSEGACFKKIALSGVILDQTGKKISKYKLDSPLLNELQEDNPDCVRLGLLKQTFGRDFKIPFFEQEEKLRRKTINCIKYLSSHTINSEKENSIEKDLDLSSDYESILKLLTSFRFNEGYSQFRTFVHDKLSKEVIEKIKLRGISKKTKEDNLKFIKNLSEIFIPISLNSFLG